MSFSRTWKPSLWNVTIQRDRDSISQFLWDRWRPNSGRPLYLLQVVKLSPVMTNENFTFPWAKPISKQRWSKISPSPQPLKMLWSFISRELWNEVRERQDQIREDHVDSIRNLEFMRGCQRIWSRRMLCPSNSLWLLHGEWIVMEQEWKVKLVQ